MQYGTAPFPARGFMLPPGDVSTCGQMDKMDDRQPDSLTAKDGCQELPRAGDWQYLPTHICCFAWAVFPTRWREDQIPTTHSPYGATDSIFAQMASEAV